MPNLFEGVVNEDRINNLSLQEIEIILNIFGGPEKVPTFEDLKKIYEDMTSKKDPCPTWYLYLKRQICWWDGNDDLAIVMHYDEEADGYYGMVARKPSNSLMSEYGYDWTDIDETEISLESAGDLEWLYKTGMEAFKNGK